MLQLRRCWCRRASTTRKAMAMVIGWDRSIDPAVVADGL